MVGAGTGGGCSGGALSDYTSDLWFEATFRVTDKNNAAGTTPGTASDRGFPLQEPAAPPDAATVPTAAACLALPASAHQNGVDGSNAVDGGESTENAVRQAITATAGVITSAALVMIGVFALFGTLSSLELKQTGVGLAVAVLLDATLIRVVLLPASMKLLGEWNWYLPRVLQGLSRRGRAPAGGALRLEIPPR